MRSRALVLLLGLLLGGAAAWLWLRASAPGAPPSLAEASARARAFFLNETNQDYRRARQELLPFAEALAGSAAYHLDLALIDLAELNHEVQGQYDLVPEPSRYVRLLESALAHLERADALAPDDEAIDYNLARTYAKLAAASDDEQRYWKAARRLAERLANVSSPDPAALLLLGDCCEYFRDWRQALDAYARIEGMGADFVPQAIWRTALFRAAQAMLYIPERREEGERRLREFQEKFKDAARGAPAATERGRYTAFLDLAERGPTRPDPRKMGWRRVTARAGIPAAGDPRFFLAPDLDGDCARDLVMNASDGLRVLRNRRNGTFEDLTEAAGFPSRLAVGAAAAGDLDNDGHTDLVVGGPEGVRIFLRVPSEEEAVRWRFRDATAALGERAREPATAIALWDLDHDGDLDIFAGGARNRVFRTVVEQPDPATRELAFAEIAAQIGLEAPPARDALILDVDDDQDVDLLVASDTEGAWFANLRMLRFERKELPGGAPLAAGDVDNDQLEEVLAGGRLLQWDGSGWRTIGERLALLDLDGDGVFDPEPLLGIEPPGSVLRAVGADLNRDGDTDLLLLTERGLDLYLSTPERPAAWLDVRPRGRGTNRAGIGVRVALYAGDLRAAATVRDGLLSFGLGRRTVIDALLFRWTNGVEQGVALPRMDDCLAVEEREGEVGSCPFVYAFDGTRWHFVADCHSGTPLGLPYADGKFLPPRSHETILVPGDLLRPVDGRLRIDVTEEFRELFYVDRVALRAIDRPREARAVLHEAFRMRPVPRFEVHCVENLRPPAAARDHRGRDLLARVSARDGRHAVPFEPLPPQYEGLAHPWWIELDFGPVDAGGRIALVMDGWVEFPTASASIAASQSRSVAFRMPQLEALAPDGSWVVVEPDAGFPAGKSKSVWIDLSGRVPAPSLRLRLSSTQRLHWDAFLLATEPDAPCTVTELPLLFAHHGFHGQGERVLDPEGELPVRYDHDRLVAFHRWDQLPAGMLTRYGDVAELLRAIDDRYPVLASGDKLELAFDATKLPPLPEGWTRDYALSTEGWVKDADMNQAVRESVEPLPFHAMSAYPYAPPEAHPDPDFVREWFTRPSRRLVDPETLLAKPGSNRAR